MVYLSKKYRLFFLVLIFAIRFNHPRFFLVCFYHFVVFDSLNLSYNVGELSNSQKQAIITLLE